MIRVALLASLGVLGVSATASGQSVMRHAQSPVVAKNLTIVTEITSRAAERPMHLVDVKLIKARSINPVVQAQIEDLSATTEAAMLLITPEALRAGKIDVAMKTVNAVSLIDEHTINIRVDYEARSVGGILTVGVSMTPSFRGIGISMRPTVSRSIAQAVDELNDVFVKTMVAELTEEIKAEFAKMETSGSVIE